MFLHSFPLCFSLSSNCFWNFDPCCSFSSYFVLRRIDMYSDCLRLESYCKDSVKVLRFVYGVVHVISFTKKVKHTLAFLKNKEPCPSFRIICFWSTKHRMLEFWNLLSWGFDITNKLTGVFNTTQVLLMHNFDGKEIIIKNNCLFLFITKRLKRSFTCLIEGIFQEQCLKRNK